MEGNGDELEDIDFSIIGPNKDKPNQINFSVDSILTMSDHENSLKHHQSDTPEINQNKTEQQNAGGSFMRDLQKIEKSLSYESAIHNIYETSELPVEITRTIEGKQESICTKTINNITSVTKGTSRVQQPGFQHLILDFQPTEFSDSSLKQRQNFQNYFGLNQINKNKGQEITKNTSRSQLKRKKKYLSSFPIRTVTEMYHKKQQQYPLAKGYKISSNDIQFNIKSSRTLRSTSPKPIISARDFKPRKNKAKQTNQQYRKQPKKGSQNIDRNSNSSSRNHLKSISHSSLKNRTVKLRKNPQKNDKDKQKTRNTREDIYSEYFGFAASLNSPSNKSKMQHSTQNSTRRQKSKKKIVFSKKNIYSNVYNSSSDLTN